jgi:hypothetical protein
MNWHPCTQLQTNIQQAMQVRGEVPRCWQKSRATCGRGMDAMRQQVYPRWYCVHLEYSRYSTALLLTPTEAQSTGHNGPIVPTQGFLCPKAIKCDKHNHSRNNFCTKATCLAVGVHIALQEALALGPVVPPSSGPGQSAAAPPCWVGALCPQSLSTGQ